MFFVNRRTAFNTSSECHEIHATVQVYVQQRRYSYARSDSFVRGAPCQKASTYQLGLATALLAYLRLLSFGILNKPLTPRLAHHNIDLRNCYKMPSFRVGGR